MRLSTTTDFQSIDEQSKSEESLNEMENTLFEMASNGKVKCVRLVASSN